jgi:signal transduction histidine kinase
MVRSDNYWLMLLSAVVAVAASYVALDLTSRLVASKGRPERRTRMAYAELSRINGLLQDEVGVRARSQAALRAARDELETRVSERTADLVQSNESVRVSEQQLRLMCDERENLLRNLHDNIVQSIYVAGMNLEEIQRLAHTDPARAAAEAALTVGVLNGAISDIRRYIDGPSERIDTTPLPANLFQLVQLSGADLSPSFRLEVDAAAAGRLTPDDAEQVLQITREAMSNARRHSHSKHASVTLAFRGDDVLLEVSDDGQGFGPADLKQDGGGLDNMRARAREIGAGLEIRSSPDKGTRIVLHIPKGGVLNEV